MIIVVVIHGLLFLSFQTIYVYKTDIIVFIPVNFTSFDIVSFLLFYIVILLYI